MKFSVTIPQKAMAFATCLRHDSILSKSRKSNHVSKKQSTVVHLRAHWALSSSVGLPFTIETIIQLQHIVYDNDVATSKYLSSSLKVSFI